jgi:hypothetical protein
MAYVLLGRRFDPPILPPAQQPNLLGQPDAQELFALPIVRIADLNPAPASFCICPTLDEVPGRADPLLANCGARRSPRSQTCNRARAGLEPQRVSRPRLSGRGRQLDALRGGCFGCSVEERRPQRRGSAIRPEQAREHREDWLLLTQCEQAPRIANGNAASARFPGGGWLRPD